MPLTSKGKKVLKNMQREYGPEKGKAVFYASINKGRLMGVESESRTSRRIRESPRKDGRTR